MSAKLSQPTPWKYDPWHVEEDSDAVRDANNDLVCCVAGSDIANLIAEAGTVYHETGLTPRQLLDLANKHREQAQVYLEQRNELMEALSDFDSAFASFDPEDKASRFTMRQAVIAARAAITRATTP